MRLTDDKGVQVDGEPREDGSSWVPSAPLQPRRTYTAEVTATGDCGPDHHSDDHVHHDGETDQAGDHQHAVLRRQPDVRHGDAGDRGVRPAHSQGGPGGRAAAVVRQDRSAAAGHLVAGWRTAAGLLPGARLLAAGHHDQRPGRRWRACRSARSRYGDADRTATSKIGRQVALEIDNATKQMSVYQDGKLVRTDPGQPRQAEHAVSSGKMVIMEKHERTTSSTPGASPNGGYVVDVDDAQRLTWGGEFIHAAPWSEGDQGYTNVSHGCANVSPPAADWLMGDHPGRRPGHRQGHRGARCDRATAGPPGT